MNQKNEMFYKCFFLAKYIVVILLFILSYRVTRSIMSPLAGCCEVIILFFLDNYFAIKKFKFRKIIIAVPFFLICAEAAVHLFVGRYITAIMISNVSSIGMLRGRFVQYLGVVLLVVLIQLIPTKPVFNHPKAGGISILLVLVLLFVDIGMCMNSQEDISPTEGLISLSEEYYNRINMYRMINNNNFQTQASEYYNLTIEDGITKPTDLPAMPNVVLIFMEGCSQNIIDDSRDIMPNIREFQNKGITFENYYNHTAATYRGIFGQLFSTHKFYTDRIDGLVSIQSILHESGYETVFVNSEPYNREFTDYLECMGFDSVESNGNEPLTDGQDYDCVFDVIEQAEADESPVFVATYTAYTHVGLDSPEEIYGDGSNRLLNRFYNSDYQFGSFLNKLTTAGYDKNTIIILTTDHASAMDDDYINTFSGAYDRVAWFCDEIPLTIYYNDVDPCYINVDGRNSLCLAPTILDFLDISAPNYFLGESLFVASDANEFDTIFWIPEDSEAFSTDGGEVRCLTEEEIKRFQRIYIDSLFDIA